eukprot:2329841-Karenia_brevis.AAC.1
MAVVQRFKWILERFKQGFAGIVTVSPASAPQRIKIRIRLYEDNGTVRGTMQDGMYYLLLAFEPFITNNTAMDRGHKYSSGPSDVSFFVDCVPGRFADLSRGTSSQMVINSSDDSFTWQQRHGSGAVSDSTGFPNSDNAADAASASDQR